MADYTVQQVITDVKDIVQLPSDDEYYASDYTKLVNFIDEGMGLIAAGVFQWPDIPNMPEIFLNELLTSGTLTTNTSNAYISLPTNYLKGRPGYPFIKAYSTTKSRELIILPSMDKLLEIYPALDETTSVQYITRGGGYVYYQGKPTSAESITVWYYKKHTALTYSSTVTELPSHLQKPLLVNYCAFRVLKNLESKTAEGKSDSEYYRNEFVTALQMLYQFIGPVAFTQEETTDVLNYDNYI